MDDPVSHTYKLLNSFVCIERKCDGDFSTLSERIQDDILYDWMIKIIIYLIISSSWVYIFFYHFRNSHYWRQYLHHVFSLYSSHIFFPFYFSFAARGKGKKTKKLLLPLLLLFKLKAAALLPLVLGFLALIAFKALIIGKLALLLSGIIGLKKLFESKNSSQNYEVVAHPHTSFDEHGHYGRSIDDSQNLAYSAYKQ